jgi:tetratricopeptide (TPR) repeat protein
VATSSGNLQAGVVRTAPDVYHSVAPYCNAAPGEAVAEAQLSTEDFMTMLDRNPTRSTRAGLLGRLFAVTLLVVAVAGCGKSEAQQTTDALQAGIKAYIANNYDEALKQWKECLKHDSTNKICHYDIGLVYQNQGQRANAENEYRLSLSTDPNYGPALFNLAIARTQDGDTTEALSLYAKYVQLNPNDAGGHLNYGLLLIATGNKTEGEKEVAIAVQLDPKISLPLPSASPTPPTPTPTPTESPTESPTRTVKPSPSR